MIHKIREHVEQLFRDAPRSPRANELKEELISNLTDRYSDLIQEGETEEAAFGIVIAGIGNVDELLNGLREQEFWDPYTLQTQRQRSALFKSIAVGLFIISMIFPFALGILGEELGIDLLIVLGVILMFVCIAFGVGLLVYNAQSRPKYVQVEETVVEDFKEWTSNKKKRKSLYGTIQSLVWTVTAPLYLCLGFFFNAWHPGWMIFILAVVVNQIIRLIYLYQEQESE